MKRRIQYLTVLFVLLCTAGITLPTNYREIPGSFLIPGDLVFRERADHAQTPESGYGYLWVRSSDNALVYTGEGGTDTALGAGGGGGGHTIEDEGTPLTTRTSLNFTGSGVTAADSGGKTVVTISSGSGDALVANPLSQFAATTSAQLLGVLSDETGTGAAVFSTSPTFTTPILGTPTSGTLTNATGLPIATGLAAGTSANLAGVISDETGSGALVFGTSPTLVTPALGTPASGVLTNATGLPITGLASGTSANLLGVLSDETGTGAAVFATSPTLVTPALGTPSAVVLTNATGLPVAGGGTGVATLGDAGVLIGNGTGAVNVTTAGTSLMALISNGAGVDPTFQSIIDSMVSNTLTASLFVGSGSTTNAIDLATAEAAGTLTVAKGGTGVATLGDAGVLIGNATGVVQVTSAGTAGQVLTSNGAAVDPTFQAAPVTLTNTATLTNKRITPRAGTTAANSATPAIDLGSNDIFTITGQSATITSMTTGLTGTLTTGEQRRIQITGTGAVGITWGASFASGVATLPTTTVTTQKLCTLFEYDGTVLRCMATGSY